MGERGKKVAGGSGGKGLALRESRWGMLQVWGRRGSGRKVILKGEGET